MHDILWPTELLGRILHFLAIDGAERQFHQLVNLTTKNETLKMTAEKLERPLVFKVAFDKCGEEEDAEENDTTLMFPFCQRTLAQIEIHWGDGTIDIVQDSDVKFVLHEFPAAGEYTVRVFRAHSNPTGGLDHIGFSTGDIWLTGYWWGRLRSIESLGNIGIRSLSALFHLAEDIQADLTKLDVGDITDMSEMFHCAYNFNQPIGRWNVGNVTSMKAMFYCATNFNQPIGSWDVSKVTSMSHMFRDALKFNQPLDAWNVKNVADMECAFGDRKTELPRWFL